VIFRNLQDVEQRKPNRGWWQEDCEGALEACAILDERKLTNFRSLQGEAVKLEDM
jgi:hypothetical protein